MNENKPFRCAIFENGLRKAFIRLQTREIPKIQRELMRKMRKAIAIALLAIVAVSSLAVAASLASAMPWSGSRTMMNTDARASLSNRWTQKTWVRVDGVITKWGSVDAKGFLDAQARTALFNVSDSRQFAQAKAMWTTNTSRPLNTVRDKQNFTLTFYAARLMNASVSQLSYANGNFFLNGTWNVYNVTTQTTIITDSDNEITNVHRVSDTTVAKVYGELNVTDNWTKFTLSLTGYDKLSGSVIRSMTRQMQFNPFKVSDDQTSSTSNMVTKTDLVTVARNFRAMPGWGNYDQKMDFNCNYKIDIADLSTVASNVS